MSFSVHTFETNPKGNLGFAFHHNLSEGQDLYFLAKFSAEVKDTEALAESMFGAIVDYFDENPNQDAYDRFEEGLKMVNKVVKKETQDLHGAADILVTFFDFHHLYLSQAGNSEAYLLRNGSVSQISEFPEEGEDMFINILSGQVAIEDTIMLSSHRVLRSMTSNQLVDTFNRPNFAEAVSVFRHELSAKSEEDILVTVIGVGKKESISAAGFLSKVIAKKDELLQKDDTEEPAPTRSQKTAEEVPDTQEDEEVIPTEEELIADLEEAETQSPASNFQEKYADIKNNFKFEQWIPYIGLLLFVIVGFMIYSFAKGDPMEATEVDTGRSPLFWGIFAVILLLIGALVNPQIRKQILGKLSMVNKNAILIAGAVLILFVLMLFLKNLDFESEEEGVLREKLSIARENLQQADAFLLQGDKNAAKENLSLAEESAQAILKSKSKFFRSDAQFILADIQKKQLQVENAHNTTPKVVADLGVKNDNIEAIGLLELRGNLYVHDANRVHKTIRNIVEKALNISEKATVLAATTRKDQNLLLFLTNDPQIVEYKEGLLTPMRTTDENWKKGIDIKTYGRFTYFLDPTENQIWKYERKRANYSGAIAYNQGADLSRSVSFAIDGAIYIIADDGSLQKIFRGEKQNYEFREVPSMPMEGKNLKIYTTPELDYLYVLDPDNERLLLFVKGDQFATYKKQVIFDLPDARDFTINESGQKVNILTKDKIYEFAL